MRFHNGSWDSRPVARANGRQVQMVTRLLMMLVALTMIVACGGANTGTDTSGQASPAAGTGRDNTAAEASPDAAQASPEASPEAAAPAPTPTEIPISTVGTGSKKIEWWHISTQENQRENWQNLANAFVQEHPDVSIEITVLENEAFKSKLATAMQSGSPPDIFQTWGGGVLRQYGDAGLVQDLTPALQENGWGESFHEGPLSLYTFDGQTFGVPWNAGGIGFWCNEALFEQAGITEKPATWDQLLEAVQQLKDAGITPIALAGRDKWPGHFYWVYLAMRMGGQEAFERAYTREGSFADEPFVEAGRKLKELIDLQPFQNGFLGAGYGDQQVIMANGQAAMELMGQWAPGANAGAAENPDEFRENLCFFPFPSVEGGAGQPSDVLGGGDGFAVGKDAPPEAIDFVRFLTSVENQTAMASAGIAVPPVVKGAEDAMEDPLLQEVQALVANAGYYQLYYDQYLPPAVGQAVNDATQGLFAGTLTPEQVAQTIEEAAAFELEP